MSDNFQNQEPQVIRPHGKRLGREFAMSFLFSCEMRGETPRTELFDSFFETAAPEYAEVDEKTLRRAADYAAKLYVSVALNQEKIDAILSPLCMNWDWMRLSAVDRNIMRVAVAEMLEFDEVPLVVSIDEAVEIARDFSGIEGGNFINGVLNSVKNKLVESGKKSR